MTDFTAEQLADREELDRAELSQRHLRERLRLRTSLTTETATDSADPYCVCKGCGNLEVAYGRCLFHSNFDTTLPMQEAIADVLLRAEDMVHRSRAVAKGESDAATAELFNALKNMAAGIIHTEPTEIEVARLAARCVQLLMEFPRPATPRREFFGGAIWLNKAKGLKFKKGDPVYYAEAETEATGKPSVEGPAAEEPTLADAIQGAWTRTQRLNNLEHEGKGLRRHQRDLEHRQTVGIAELDEKLECMEATATADRSQNKQAFPLPHRDWRN